MTGRKETHARFMRFVVKHDGDGCWLWTGHTADGYGRFYTAEANITQPGKAHRFAYTSWIGPIPRGQYVLHRCDVRACVRPDHLFLGTHADNMHDMAVKGRANRPNKVGEECVSSRLSNESVRQVRALLQLGITHKWIGDAFGVSRPTVSMISKGRTWQRVVT